MRLVETIANTLFYRTEDGRYVFRPWGARGPCYLVNDQQRVVRARAQLLYYCAFFVIVIFTAGEMSTFALFGILLPSFMAGNYILYWLFSRGLERTEAPPKPTKQQVKANLRKINQNFNKPALWALLFTSAAFSLIGILAMVIGGPILANLAAAVFFGAGAVFFAWQLKYR